MGEFGIGQPVPRTEDPRLLRGGGKYADDLEFAHQAHGYILRSPHAHADIDSIDTTAAKAAPGVLCILTGADWNRTGFDDFPVAVVRHRRNGTPMFIPPRKGLTADRVRQVGDPVAFVVAETLAQAQDAAELVAIDYAILPSITATAGAMAPGAVRIWDQCPGNESFAFELGDREAVDAAFAAAAHLTRIAYVVNRVSANAMEPRVSIGSYDRRDGHYTLHTSTQGVHAVRAYVAEIMKLNQSQIRVIAGDVGGAFGMKGDAYHDQVLVLWASKLLERPVRWTADRSESLMSDAHGRDNVSTVELALDSDAGFLALRVNTIANVGAYMGMMGAHSPTNNLGGLAGVYTTPAIHVEVTGVFTNSNQTGPYRGAGRPEATLAVERVIDAAARELGIDRVEIRRRNLIPPDAMPYQTGLTFTYDSGNFEDNMDKTLALADWDGFESRRAESARRGRLLGIGLANAIEQAAAPLDETAEVRFDETGHATILMGTLSQGQGHDVTYKQIVHEQLGLKLEHITLLQGDTDVISFGRGTFGSRSAGNGGAALQMANHRILDKARKVAAHMLEAAAEDIEFADGTFTVAGTDRKVNIADVARTLYTPFALPGDFEPTLAAHASFRPTAPTFPAGCHVCEVEIDEATGAIEVTRYSVVDDVGVVVNPLLLKGQIHGGVAQGLGQALMEDVAYDPDSGQLISGSFMDYCMPRADDFPAIEVVSNGTATTINPMGIKGAGEAGCVGALPCVVSAIADALAPLGVDDIPMPATTERVWRAIQGVKTGS